jgi:hypothetical protein
MSKKAKEPTLATWRARLTEGVDPRTQGGLDGHQGVRTGVAEPTPFQVLLHARAWECANEIETVVQEELAELAAQARDDPFALPGAGPRDQCASVVAEAVGEMDVRLHEDHSALIAARREAEARKRDRNLDYLRAGADAKPPPKGWPSGLATANLLMAILCFEVLLAYLVLVHELGPRKALLYGALMPVVTMAGGAAAGFLTLRPALKDKAGTIGFQLRRAAACLIFLLTGVTVYAVAAYRACLIAGQNGTAGEVASMAYQPLQVLVTMEALGLGLLGILGFMAACWKVRAFYGEFVPALRASDLAWRAAVQALRSSRDEIVDVVTEPALTGKAKIEKMHSVAMAWAKAKLNMRDLANMTVLKGNRQTEDLNRALAGVESEYRGCFAAVRTETTVAWVPMIEVGTLFDTPDLFERSARRAVETGDVWVASVVRAQAELDARRCDAIAFIDVQAGFEPTPPAPAAAARAGARALGWRRAA